LSGGILLRKKLKERIIELKTKIEQLEQEKTNLQKTNRKLNRRCQEAESAMIEWKKISAYTKNQSTGRFLPAMMRYALTKAEEKNAEQAAEIERLKQALGERKECEKQQS
jgi:hypothetical protein